MGLVYSSSNANQKSAAIRKIYTKLGIDKWQSLGVIGEGATFQVTVATSPDAVSRNRSVTLGLKVVAKLMQTSTVEMWGMYNLCTGVGGVLPDFLLEQADADTSGYTIGYAYLTGLLNVRATCKLVVPPDTKQDRYIELTLTGSIPISLESNVVSPTVAGADFLAAGTTLASTVFAGFASGGTNGAWTNVNIGFPSRIFGGSIKAFSIQDALATGYISFGALKNTNLSIEITGDNDSLGRPMATWAMVTLDLEHTETPNATELALLTTWNRTQIDSQTRTPDDRYFTFDLADVTQLGFAADYMSGGKVTDKRVVKVTQTGGFDAALLSSAVIS